MNQEDLCLDIEQKVLAEKILPNQVDSYISVKIINRFPQVIQQKPDQLFNNSPATIQQETFCLKHQACINQPQDAFSQTPYPQFTSNKRYFNKETNLNNSSSPKKQTNRSSVQKDFPYSTTRGHKLGRETFKISSSLSPNLQTSKIHSINVSRKISPRMSKKMKYFLSKPPVAVQPHPYKKITRKLSQIPDRSYRVKLRAHLPSIHKKGISGSSSPKFSCSTLKNPSLKHTQTVQKKINQKIYQSTLFNTKLIQPLSCTSIHDITVKVLEKNKRMGKLRFKLK